MTHKNKVKELVGGGLNAYHTKALQQMDRIEKKNKEQNHKISILSNELDNDYLTKTEEGSVISLEHSKEGMVYLDELQGNTLVNYCTDGSKEMTLNGDKDVEGTFVTTTEGVDNGKVDVMCEGNTLVNLNELSKCRNYKSESGLCEITVTTDVAWNEVGVSGKFLVYKLKPNTVYTVFMDIKKNTIGENSKFYLNITAENRAFLENYAIDSGYIGNIIKKVTTRPDLSNVDTGLLPSIKDAKQGQNIAFKYMILEGDWTNREIPKEYFEGMKSVGQDNVNGHKIEILSQNKNFLINGFVSGNIDNNGVLFNQVSYLRSLDYEHCIPNTEIIASYNSLFRFSQFFFFDKDKIFIDRKTETRATVPNNAKYFKLVLAKKDGTEVTSGDINSYANKTTMVRLSNQTDVYIEPKLNKKEILLNEPLRSIENINKDRIVKIGNKLFIERNLAQITLDGTENWIKWSYETPLTQLDTHLHCTIRIANIKYYSKECANIVTDKFKSVSTRGTLGEYIYHDGWNDTICIKILQSKLETPDASGFKKWLQNNPMELIYELVTPIYEPLEIEPILNTYTDITHISNNSLIPCNMKVKNSGYNAIIKPSTLYTIALDTNKSGTIGMNLGGVKGTTTNNVLTLTTPATLSDDSLRLYGKGIKGSKVRLLEGDKTNWIPSHFEGMKSCFEDKFDATDNTYKMEISSNNKNLLKLDDIVMKGIGAGCTLDACSTDLIQYTSNQAEWTQIFFMMKLKPFTRYTLSAELQSMNVYVFNDRVGTWDANKYIGTMQNTTNTLQKKQFSFTTNKTGCISIRFTNERMLGVNIAKNIMLSEVVGDYTSKKSNKIQFSSIEPLRRYKNSVDKFVFKDKKLMIERNCAIKIFNGSENWNYSSWINNNGRINRFELIVNTPSYSYQISNKYKYIWGDYPDTYYRIDNGTLFVYTQTSKTLSEFKQELKENNLILLGELTEPTYEEIPFELQKIILEGYENGTLFFDTNIPPTSTVTYAGETPIVKATKLNKTEVLNNTTDINDNIIPYLMDMDYRVVCLELAAETQGISMARLFGGVYEMLKRDILSSRYSIDEYKHRLDVYLSANKITNEEYEKLGDMLNE